MIGYSLILILLVVLVIAGCKTSRAGYESAPYRVVRTAGQFEVRDYPPLTVVETPMQGPASGMNGSFNRLFKFITGGNGSKEKIAMTTPVFITGNESNATMAFVMPANIYRGKCAQAGGRQRQGAGVAGRSVRGNEVQRRAQREKRKASSGSAKTMDGL